MSEVRIALHNSYSVVRTSDPRAWKVMKEACTVWWTVFSKYGQKKAESACYLSMKTGAYPTGWTSLVIAAFKKAGITCRMVDLRKNNGKSYKLGKTTMHLRDYQEKGSEAALVKSRGIISHATGSGKTVTAAVTIQKIGRKTIYFVPNRTLLEQTARGSGRGHPCRVHRKDTPTTMNRSRLRRSFTTPE